LAVALALLGLAAAVFPQCFGSFKHGIIPVVAEAPGGGGSYWNSDAYFTDTGAPGRANNKVELWVWLQGMPPLRSVGKEFTIPAGGTLRVPNVLSELGVSLSSIYILNFQATYDVMASVRIYNTGSVQRELQPGFGQGIMAMPEKKGLSTGEFVIFPVPLDFAEARVNVGFANTGWNKAKAIVYIFDDQGSEIPPASGNRSVLELEPQEVKQFTVNPHLSGTAPGSIMIYMDFGDPNTGYAYVSVVDNVTPAGGQPTSDPSFYVVYK
jgi:hypothetical protein